MRYLKSETPICEAEAEWLRARLAGEGWALICPCGVGCADGENERKMTALKAKTRALGCGFIQIAARWASENECFDEYLLLIPDISYRKAYTLSRDCAQSTFVVKDAKGCREVCANEFADGGRVCAPGETVRAYGAAGTLDDAAGILAKRRGSPAGRAEEGGLPFRLMELYAMEQPRPSYFQTGYRLSKIWEAAEKAAEP